MAAGEVEVEVVRKKNQVCQLRKVVLVQEEPLLLINKRE